MTSPRHSNITIVRPDRFQVILYALLTVKFDGSRRAVLEHMAKCSKAPDDEEAA